MKYRTIVVDPPWQYRQTLAKNGAVSHYGVMTHADLLGLGVGDWADDSAHLYLWTTNAFMVQAHELAAAWGFDQKTILTWIKSPISLGFYFRNNTEHVLFCVKGSLRCARVDVPTAFEEPDGVAFNAPRGRHSEKPAAFYDMVMSISPGPYLDVFARKNRFNWDAFGNECWTAPHLQEYLPDDASKAFTAPGLPEPVRSPLL